MTDGEANASADDGNNQHQPDLRRAYDDGRAAALAGEEAAPGCTTTEAGKAWLRGYVAGAAERGE